MIKWLLQPVKVEQDKMDNLMNLLTQGDIPFDIVYPLEEQILNPDKSVYQFQDNVDYFVCGSYPLTRYVHKIKPQAVFSLENIDIEKQWNIFGKDNFINADAQIVHTTKIDWNQQEEYFVRPLEDTKSFNGGIYNQNTLTFEGMVIVAPLKEITKEYRFFIVDNQIVTASQYKMNGSLFESSIIDEDVKGFVEDIKNKFDFSGYVIDIGIFNNQPKIMELNCLNASGFYSINLYKLIIAIEDHYEKKKIKEQNIIDNKVFKLK